MDKIQYHRRLYKYDYINAVKALFALLPPGTSIMNYTWKSNFNKLSTCELYGILCIGFIEKFDFGYFAIQAAHDFLNGVSISEIESEIKELNEFLLNKE